MSSCKIIKKQTAAKFLAITCTCIFIALFPALTWMALFWSAAADASTMLDFFVMFTWFWTPLSIPITIYFIWLNYAREDYRKSKLFCCLPFSTFGGFVIANALISLIR